MHFGGEKLAFARTRIPEICVVLFGALLRFSMLSTYDPRVGYDAHDHLKYIEWFQHHWELPGLLLSRETYHPPLYYVIAGVFARATHGAVSRYGMLSMTFSMLTMLTLWAGLERHSPARRIARVASLTLFAVLPASVHPAGMMTGEGLNGFLATVGLLLGAEIASRQRAGRKVAALSLGVGVVIGLQMLTKISGLVILAAVCGGLALGAVVRRGNTRKRVQRVFPCVLILAGFLATSGWYFARNQALHGKAVLSGYDGLDKKTTKSVDAVPYIERRPLDFYYGWSQDVLSHPYYPSGVRPRSYFWPPLIGSTFVDYYNYEFVKAPARRSGLTANGRPLRRDSKRYANASVTGGLPIAVATVIAWLGAVIWSLRRGSTAPLVFLLAPLLAVLGQLHFAVRYPYDVQGPIKGIYLQFASAPLYALFGLAMETLMKRRVTLPLAALGAAALLSVAGYTLYARCFAV